MNATTRPATYYIVIELPYRQKPRKIGTFDDWFEADAVACSPDADGPRSVIPMERD